MTFNLNHNYQIHNHQNEKKLNRFHKIFDVFVCIVIRLIFIAQTLFSIYYLVHIYNFLYLILVVCVIVITVDSIYVTIYRNGKEYTWLIF